MDHNWRSIVLNSRTTQIDRCVNCGCIRTNFYKADQYSPVYYLDIYYQVGKVESTNIMPDCKENCKEKRTWKLLRHVFKEVKVKIESNERSYGQIRS